MKYRILLTAALSIISALLLATVFRKLVVDPQNFASARSGMKQIVFALRTLAVGATIKPSDISLRTVPAGFSMKGEFSKPEEVIDRPVTSIIYANEPVTESRLASRGSGFGLSPVIPVGMRAVTVAVDDFASIGGFVLPGMRVDVLFTAGGTNDPKTVTILQNMLVLSVGEQMQPPADGRPIKASLIILLATPEQTEDLVAAGLGGKIRLSLRNGSDQAFEKVLGTTVSKLIAPRAWISITLVRYQGTWDGRAVRHGKLTYKIKNEGMARADHMKMSSFCRIVDDNADEDVPADPVPAPSVMSLGSGEERTAITSVLIMGKFRPHATLDCEVDTELDRRFSLEQGSRGECKAPFPNFEIGKPRPIGLTFNDC